MKTTPIRRKPLPRGKVYLVFLVFSLFMAVIRTSLFPNTSFWFHAALTASSYACFMFIWETILFIGPRLERVIPQQEKLYVRVIIQVVISFLLALSCAYIVRDTVITAFGVPPNPTVIVFGYLLCFMMSLIMNLMYFGSIYFNEWKENLVRTAILQHEKAQVKYDGLKNQLNPHFLFNALASLNSLIYENQQLASEFLQQLSKVYRYTLQNKDKECVDLKTECEFITHYILLIKTRFNTAIHFTVDIQEEAKEKGIVPVTLQMLIENAVKHNVLSESQPLVISITSDGDTVIVENSVSKKDQVATSNKQGLVNLKTLYQYLSDRPVEIIETPKTFTVKLPLI